MPENKKEKQIQDEIIRDWGTRKWLRIWRQNTGVGKYIDRSGRLREVRFGLPGQADITGILPDGKRLEIEVKSARGKLSPEQAAFCAMIIKHGGVYILARSSKDVYNALAVNGYSHLLCD